MSYGNFKDPLGLLKRMLASGNKIAYFTLLREGLGMLFRPLDWILQHWERRRIQSTNSSGHPILLILGGSRSGTTLLYQTLVQYLPVSYFSNLSASFPRSTISASKLFYPFLSKRKGNFKNYYGSVGGFNGPNDGFPIWNRWLGEDRSHVPDHIPPDQLADMRQFFRAWQTAFPRPFINKNNRNTLGMVWFEAGLDDVRYLEIRRHPVYVVQSLILSREAIQGSKYIGWGLKARDSRQGADPLCYIDDICRQVFEVEKSLDAVRASIPADRYRKITYENFCADPVAVVQEVARFLGVKPVPESDLKGLAPFRNTNVQKVEKQEWERIRQCMIELYGEDRTVEHPGTKTTNKI